MPRGLKFLVELHDGEARGYVCENYGAQFRLPELGPIGSNGLANARDFLTPVAAYEDSEGDFRVVAKFQGNLWEAAIDHSPLDVVAWHGNYAPYKYDLARFNTVEDLELAFRVALRQPLMGRILIAADLRPYAGQLSHYVLPLILRENRRDDLVAATHGRSCSERGLLSFATMAATRPAFR